MFHDTYCAILCAIYIRCDIPFFEGLRLGGGEGRTTRFPPPSTHKKQTNNVIGQILCYILMYILCYIAWYGGWPVLAPSIYHDIYQKMLYSMIYITKKSLYNMLYNMLTCPCAMVYNIFCYILCYIACHFLLYTMFLLYSTKKVWCSTIRTVLYYVLYT